MVYTQYELRSEQARVRRHIEAQCACTADATQTQGAHACYSSECTILQQILHRYIISWGTMYIAVIATSG